MYVIQRLNWKSTYLTEIVSLFTHWTFLNQHNSLNLNFTPNPNVEQKWEIQKKKQKQLNSKPHKQQKPLECIKSIDLYGCTESFNDLFVQFVPNFVKNEISKEFITVSHWIATGDSISNLHVLFFFSSLTNTQHSTGSITRKHTYKLGVTVTWTLAFVTEKKIITIWLFYL